MTKIRIFLFLVTLIVVGAVAYFVSMYARGYRFNENSLKFSPHGLLVVKSDPDGAQVYINEELKTATNATIPLAPGTYDVSIRKDGFFSWNKRLTIKKEEVTETTAQLFKSVPSLSALTFSGSINPIPSDDMSKVSYVVPFDSTKTGSEDKSGLWILETVDLPLGFTREPRRITDGDLSGTDWSWSPDGREILLITKTGTYLLSVSSFTSQKQRVNINLQKDKTLTSWDAERKLKLTSKIKGLPEELQSILERKAKSIVFSPDEDMVLYTASGSAVIPQNLIKPLPGTSTQKEERNIINDKTYIYDIKEDRNFLVDDASSDLVIGAGYLNNSKRRMMWFPTSRHLILAETGKIIIMDYDGTNRQEIYAGNYIAPHAYPTISHDRLLIVTNLGATSVPNVYTLSLK